MTRPHPDMRLRVHYTGKSGTGLQGKRMFAERESARLTRHNITPETQALIMQHGMFDAQTGD